MNIKDLMIGMKKIGWDLQEINEMNEKNFIELLETHEHILTNLWFKVNDEGEKHGLLEPNEPEALGFIVDLLGVIIESEEQK